MTPEYDNGKNEASRKCERNGMPCQEARETVAKPVNDNGRYLFIVQDFYVEVMGAFIPGFLFVSTVFFLSMYFYYYATFGRFPFGTHMGTMVSHWGFWVFSGCLSYAFGVVFYRMQLKRIDLISCFRQWGMSSCVEKRKLSVQFDAERRDSSDDDYKYDRYLAEEKFGRRRKFGHNPLSYAFGYKSWERDIDKRIDYYVNKNQKMKFDYPYPHLRTYLWSRGFRHLMKFVPWCACHVGNAEDGESAEDRQMDRRSKHCINIIKQRIRIRGTIGMCLDLIRNEGQIRLLGSLWYVFKIVRSFINYALVLGVCALLARVLYIRLSDSGIAMSLRINCAGVENQNFWAYQCYYLVLVLMKVIATQFKWHIEKCLHYVRTREIVMILETAHLIWKEDPDVFGDLVKRTEEFVNDVCGKCKEHSCNMCGVKYTP